MDNIADCSSALYWEITHVGTKQRTKDQASTLMPGSWEWVIQDLFGPERDRDVECPPTRPSGMDGYKWLILHMVRQSIVEQDGWLDTEQAKEWCEALNYSDATLRRMQTPEAREHFLASKLRW